MKRAPSTWRVRLSNRKEEFAHGLLLKCHCCRVHVRPELELELVENLSLLTLGARGRDVELLIRDIDCLVEEHGTASDIKAVRMFHFDIDFVQVLIPCEWWCHLDGCTLLLLNLIKHGLVLSVDLR